MRVLQLIDTLRPGGAERMAVNYANGLASRTDASFLCCTRMEGLLKEQLSSEVGYLFLNKKSAIDRKAFLLLKRFIKENKINLIQAHSSSFFLAVLIKMSIPGIKLVWHDHYGRELKSRRAGVLVPFSRSFDLVISVNRDLERWAKRKLFARKVIFVRNFIPDVAFQDVKPNRSLRPVRGGGKDEFRIICLANLRPQKDHLNLLKAFLLVHRNHKNVSLHLVGKTIDKEYEKEILSFIRKNDLEDQVNLYGERSDIQSLLQEADLGVLSSSSEGLPVALLEYGAARLASVCTEVGECSSVIGSNGKLVPPGNPDSLARAIEEYIQDPRMREKDAADFQKRVAESFGEEAVLTGLIGILEEVLASTK